MPPVRIGTWNLAGRWSDRHHRLIEDTACDVWLLTEVGARTDLASGHLLRSAAMPGTGGRSWAALWSDEPLHPVASVHEAAAVAHWRDLLLCSCVLPWRSARATWPDREEDVAGMTRAALGRLRPALAGSPVPVIWGGDWNHAMNGTEYAGTKAGRIAITDLVAEVGLTVTTGAVPHRIDGLLSIDHIAVPSTWLVSSCRRVPATDGDRRLSDHDAYVTEVAAPA